MYEIFNTVLVIAVFRKVKIQSVFDSDSYDGKTWCLYKADKKPKYAWRYMESIALQTGAKTVHWEDNTSCISIVEAKAVTPILKNIEIPVCSLQEKFENGTIITKHEKYSIFPIDMCTKT